MAYRGSPTYISLSIKARRARADTEMKEQSHLGGPPAEESEGPSKDFSRRWQMRKSPSCGSVFSGPTTGKWCIFAPSSDVDVVWSKIKRAVEGDKLLFAKVSTALRSMGRDGHVICVYTQDWTDKQDLLRVREVLRSLGFVEELGYKRDIDTQDKVYGPDEWYLRA